MPPHRLIVAALCVLCGCEKVEQRVEHSELMSEPAHVTDIAHVPAWTALEVRCGLDWNMDISCGPTLVNHPEVYRVVIKSESCHVHFSTAARYKEFKDMPNRYGLLWFQKSYRVVIRHIDNDRREEARTFEGCHFGRFEREGEGLPAAQ